jgi:nicotinate-nucleotide adenylyltransferase
VTQLEKQFKKNDGNWNEKEAIEVAIKVLQAVVSSDFKASDIEFKLTKPSYTIHTLLHLKEKYPDLTFYLIMGSDNLQNLHKWKNHQEIVSNNKILVYPRITPQQTNEFYNHPNITLTNAPMIEISSSFIREQIKNGKDVKYLLTEPVYKYVSEMHFYKK